MQARIKENMLDVIDTFFEGKEGHRADPEFLKLCQRIAGKVVELSFIEKDAFELRDNNYWLPNCCWEPINPNEDPKNHNDSR